jgi:CelD/BcsL family acetyltransferase involved in cellulose biosynthesis
VLTWQRHYEPRARLCVITKRERTGSLTGLLPLALVAKRLYAGLPLTIRTWVVAGSGAGAADHVGALATDGATLAELYDEASRVVGVVPVFLDGLSADQVAHAEQAMGGMVLERRRSPVLRWADPAAATLAGSKNLWRQIVRMRRRLADVGVTGQWHGPGEAQREALDALARLHASRWRARGQNGLLDRQKVAFFLDVSRSSGDATGPWVHELRQGSTPVGAILCLLTPTSVAYYQMGWAPEWANFNIGKVLLGDAIDFAVEGGAGAFDFLRGPEPFKYRFGATDVTDVVALAGRGARHRLISSREWLVAKRRDRQAAVGERGH